MSECACELCIVWTFDCLYDCVDDVRVLVMVCVRGE